MSILAKVNIKLFSNASTIFVNLKVVSVTGMNNAKANQNFKRSFSLPNLFIYLVTYFKCQSIQAGYKSHYGDLNQSINLNTRANWV